MSSFLAKLCALIFCFLFFARSISAQSEQTEPNLPVLEPGITHFSQVAEEMILRVEADGLYIFDTAPGVPKTTFKLLRRPYVTPFKVNLAVGEMPIEIVLRRDQPSDPGAYFYIRQERYFEPEEPNDFARDAKPLLPNNTTPFSLASKQDYDWFSVDAEAGNDVYLVIEHQNRAGTPHLRVWEIQDTTSVEIKGRWDESALLVGPLVQADDRPVVFGIASVDEPHEFLITPYVSRSADLDIEIQRRDIDLPIFVVGIELNDQGADGMARAVNAFGGAFTNADDVEALSEKVATMETLAKATQQRRSNSTLIWLSALGVLVLAGGSLLVWRASKKKR